MANINTAGAVALERNSFFFFFFAKFLRILIGSLRGPDQEGNIFKKKEILHVKVRVAKRVESRKSESRKGRVCVA